MPVETLTKPPIGMPVKTGKILDNSRLIQMPDYFRSLLIGFYNKQTFPVFSPRLILSRSAAVKTVLNQDTRK